MKLYPAEYTEDSSYGSAVRLLRRAGAVSGVVLDLGCGRAPLAEAVAELGCEYVGVDTDERALGEVADRGFETHVGDLGADREGLVRYLREVLSDRPLVAVLALDVLEHLTDPTSVLLAVREVARGASPAGQDAWAVVSIPNVTHVDVGSKLLLGRWDVTDTGLLDDTHVRFFSEGELERLVAAGGWAVADREDVMLPLSDQCFPTDAPALRPGAPLREILHAVRRHADPHGATYQFVRRLQLGEVRATPPRHEVDEEREVLGVVVVVPPGADPAPLQADLAAQQPPVGAVVVVPPDSVVDALRSSESRWVAVLDADTRLGQGWSDALGRHVDELAGRVVRLGVVAPSREALEAAGPAPDLSVIVSGGATFAADPLDPLHAAAPLPPVVDAHLVPVEALRASGLVPSGPWDRAGTGVAWIRQVIAVAGIEVLPDPVVAVDPTRLPEPYAAEEAVVVAEDESPILLPPGSASRLRDLRRRVVAAESSLELERRRAEQASERAEYLTATMHRLADEHRAELADLEKLRRAWARRPSRRLVALLRRFIG